MKAEIERIGWWLLVIIAALAAAGFVLLFATAPTSA